MLKCEAKNHIHTNCTFSMLIEINVFKFRREKMAKKNTHNLFAHKINFCMSPEKKNIIKCEYNLEHNGLGMDVIMLSTSTIVILTTTKITTNQQEKKHLI